MYKYVRERRASSVRGEREGREENVFVLVSGTNTAADATTIIGTGPGFIRIRTLESRSRTMGERRPRGSRRGRRRRGWNRLEQTSKIATTSSRLTEDPCEIGEPRWCLGDIVNRLANESRQCTDDGNVIVATGNSNHHWYRSSLRPQEAWTPTSIQPGSSGRYPRPTGRGAQQGWLQNRLHPPAWTQRGTQATQQWQGAFVAWPLSTGFEVIFHFFHSCKRHTFSFFSQLFECGLKFWTVKF